MSDININGIPNMGFQGGGGGYFYNPYANLMQNQAAIQNNNQAVSNASAAVGSNANTFDPFKQSGGFGTMTDYYSNLGAAYGRATGGFGGQNINNPQALSKFGNELFDADFYKSQNPDVAAAGVDPTAHWFDYGQKEGRTAHTFNPYQYQQANPDVWSAGADPYQHYKQYGITEGRTGAWSDFNPTDYLNLNPDVKAAGVDPTAHWFEFGEKEGRKGSTLSPLNSYQGSGFDAFDPNIYSGSHPTAGFGQQPTAATQQSWEDLWNSRGPYNRSSLGGANNDRNDLAAEYYANNRDVYNAAMKSGQDPTTYAMNHIMAYGADEGRTFFDPVKYGRENPDVLAAGMDPTAHWFQFGNKEGRTGSQSSVFNKETYNLLNPDVAKAGVDPLQHWLDYGQKENRMGGAFESALMYDQFPGTTFRDPWIASIPEARRTAETVNTVKALSQKYGWDPVAYAAMVQMETKDSPQELWNPTAHNKLGYWGLSQMGEDSFTDQKDGRLGGMTWQQYQRATPAQQVAMYGAWLDKYARPDNAAGLVKGGIGSLPVEMQAAIMMGTQFGPNKTEWVRALGEGNMDVPTSTKQAPELKPYTINAMRDAMARQIAAWPQNQSPWPLK